MNHLISCSNISNSSVEKNSPSVISKPSQNFLIVRIEMSLRLEYIMLYAVDGITPEGNLVDAAERLSGDPYD